MSQGKTHVPTEETRKTVRAAAGFGMNHDQISVLISVSPKTLRRRYRQELASGVATAHFNVSKTTYEQAVSGRNPTMTIWYEKTRMGMRETLQMTTPPGEPLETKGSGEAELIGAYYRRLAAAGLDAAAAAGGAPGADPRTDSPVDQGGQGPQGPGRRKATDPG